MHGIHGTGALILVLVAFPMFMPLVAAPFTYIGIFMVCKWTYKGIRHLVKKLNKKD